MGLGSTQSSPCFGLSASRVAQVFEGCLSYNDVAFSLHCVSISGASVVSGGFLHHWGCHCVGIGDLPASLKDGAWRSRAFSVLASCPLNLWSDDGLPGSLACCSEEKKWVAQAFTHSKLFTDWYLYLLLTVCSILIFVRCSDALILMNWSCIIA